MDPGQFRSVFSLYPTRPGHFHPSLNPTGRDFLVTGLFMDVTTRRPLLHLINHHSPLFVASNQLLSLRLTSALCPPLQRVVDSPSSATSPRPLSITMERFGRRACLLILACPMSRAISKRPNNGADYIYCQGRRGVAGLFSHMRSVLPVLSCRSLVVGGT
jgi:hypothetical protein